MHTDHDPGGINHDSWVAKGEVIVGFVHTHPYNKKENTGVGFSAADISVLRKIPNLKAGSFEMVESGTKRFAAVIADPVKASEFFKKNTRDDLRAKWEAVFYNKKFSNLSLAQRSEKAFKAIVGDGSVSGIRVYATFDEKKHKFRRL